MNILSGSNKLDWYALFVRAHNEFSISSILEKREGIGSLVPARKIWKKNGSGKVTVFKKPLFSSYIFVKLNLANIDWRKIYAINGVFDIVRSGGKPSSVPENQLLSAIKLGSADQPVHEMEYRRGLKANDQVEVIEGPLKGAIGRFISAYGKNGNFLVSVDIFQRTLVTELESKLVEPY